MLCELLGTMVATSPSRLGPAQRSQHPASFVLQPPSRSPAHLQHAANRRGLKQRENSALQLVGQHHCEDHVLRCTRAAGAWRLVPWYQLFQGTRGLFFATTSNQGTAFSYQFQLWLL